MMSSDKGKNFNRQICFYKVPQLPFDKVLKISGHCFGAMGSILYNKGLSSRTDNLKIIFKIGNTIYRNYAILIILHFHFFVLVFLIRSVPNNSSVLSALIIPFARFSHLRTK